MKCFKRLLKEDLSAGTFRPDHKVQLEAHGQYYTCTSQMNRSTFAVQQCTGSGDILEDAKNRLLTMSG